MSWNRRYAFISYIRSSLWIAPFIALAVSLLALKVIEGFSLDPGWIPGFAFSETGKQSAMDTDITLNMTFIVFAFGSLLVAIQVAGGQLTPRIIATMLLRDNVIRGAVALFTVGLVLAVAARNRLETIPQFAISLAAILGLLSTVTFLFLIDYAARMLRPVSIMWRVGEQGLRVIEQLYPHPTGHAPAHAQPLPAPGPPDRSVPHRGTSGIVLAVNVDALVAAARRADGVIEFAPLVGDFVAVGEPLFLLRGGATALDNRMLRAQVAFGAERTIEQDSTFALRVIVDIAAKALSKAINDPTTAVLAIDQLHRLLRAVGKRHLRGGALRDGDGHIRLIYRTPNWEEFVQLACTEIRQYGAESTQVARRLRAMIDNLMSTLPEHRRPALRRELDRLDRTLERLYALPEDLALARTADTQGLGGTAHTVNGESRDGG